jgi:hypothetical protein
VFEQFIGNGDQPFDLTINSKSYSPSSSNLLDAALQTVQHQLTQFALSPDAWQSLDSIYDISSSQAVQTRLEAWANGVFADLPALIVLEDAAMNGADGAYSAERNEIYLAQSWIQSDSLTGLHKIILEEYGHALDVQFNPGEDTTGDEGELFSLMLSGQALSDIEWLRLRTEHDFSTVLAFGQSITVEQSSAGIDINQDNCPDILWRDPSSGRNVVWFMGGANNTQIIASDALESVGGSWDIKGMADINQDNCPDILWRDPSSGRNVVWFMGGANNTQIIASDALESVGGSWDIKGMADFNQDNRPDILWRDPSSGRNVVWFMGGTNNTQIIASDALESVGGSWDIKGMADFNQDNRPDILWRDPSSGRNVVWFMGGTNNTQIIASDALESVGGSWDIKGMADFNQDNCPDILWRDPSSGRNVVWFMGGTNNTQIAASDALESVGGGWTPIANGWWQQKPDLMVQSQYAPGSATVGDTITISAYTKNNGTATADSNYLRYWLSNDTKLDSNDTFLSYDAVGSLSAGTSEYDSYSFTYDAAWGTGTKYILFEADGYKYVSEGNEDNNVAYKAITINTLQPDLIVGNQYAPGSATVGDTITISADTKNNGTVTAGSNYLRYWLSNDTTLDSSDTFLSYDSVGSLSVGASEYDSYSFTYQADWGTGTKYILFQADGYNHISESDETNNIAYKVITITSDWYRDNLKDTELISLTRSLAADNNLSRNDMIVIFRDAADGGVINSDELTDLRTLVSHANRFTMADYVKVLSNKIANSDPANTRSSFGNLYAGSSATQMENLIGKWFLGTDRPDLTNSSYTYRSTNGSLFQNGISYADVNQGSVGDCYFLAGLANTALRTASTIQSMFIDNDDGTYTVRFYNNGVVDYVTVDRYLPTNSSGSFVYAHQSGSNWGSYSNSANELWVMLAEKAYAQMNESGWLRGPASDTHSNSYNSITLGYGGYAMGDITGLNTTSDYLTTSDASTIINACNANQMVYFSSKETPTNTNVVPTHGYILTAYDAISKTFTLYNPWGQAGGYYDGYFKPGYLYLSIGELANNFRSWTQAL